MAKNLEKATFASGCFWCGEAIFEELDGVISVVSGYARPSPKASEGTAGPGFTKDKSPTYEEVSTGKTEYAEAIQLTFDPEKISYSDLLEVFWATHDPTQLNCQGPDTGHQYRSAIFYHNDEQKKSAVQSKKRLEESGEFSTSGGSAAGGKKPIVTEIAPLKSFYPAEKYHQDFYVHNPDAPYCQAVINPKLEKFRKQFKNKLKR